jgi:hypothetical protein
MSPHLAPRCISRSAKQRPSSRAISAPSGNAVLYRQEGLPDEAEAIQLYFEKRGTALHIEMKTFGWRAGYAVARSVSRIAYTSCQLLELSRVAPTDRTCG